MGNINELIADMKDNLELQKFAEQQYKTILELSKKNSELELKVNHLEKLLQSTSPDAIGDLTKLANPSDPAEKIICEIQLNRLNVLSMERELTAEESKKVETFSKILATFRTTKKADPTPAEKTTTADLLRLVQNETNEA